VHTAKAGLLPNADRSPRGSEQSDERPAALQHINIRERQQALPVRRSFIDRYCTAAVCGRGVADNKLGWILVLTIIAGS
jgi:hypothetical protein